jgi:alpha-L-fucosidase
MRSSASGTMGHSAIEDGDWYARNMYIQGSDQYHYYVQRYGLPLKVDYKDTIPA